jgi:toxin ParE1/3/4
VKFEVLVLPEAEDDLVEIYEFVAAADSPSKAEYLLTRLEKACVSLERFPARGRIPPELRRIGVTTYRETLVGPYRIVYRFGSRSVHVYAVLDGRRDLSETLERRLIH